MCEAARVAKRRARGDGTVYYETARDRWIGAVEINGKRVKTTGKTETEARRKLNLLLRQRAYRTPSEKKTWALRTARPTSARHPVTGQAYCQW